MKKKNQQWFFVKRLHTLRPEQNGLEFADDLHIRMQFVKWTVVYFDENFTEFCS